MLGATCFIFVLLFVAKTYIVFGEKCTWNTGFSGIITDEKTSSIYGKCWVFEVPKNSSVELSMELFETTVKDCSYTSVKILLENKGEKYVFCPEHRDWKPLILRDNFKISYSMSSFIYVFRNKISLKYRFGNRRCSQGNVVVCEDSSCTRLSMQCNATEQCSDEADETKCIPALTESRVNGLKSLKSKWSSTTGWQENTHRGITALFLASERNEWKANIKDKLMEKQLEVQTLVYISRKESDGMTANQLSMLVNALTVTCENPHNFYGHDLVKLLKDEVEVSSSITYSVAYLALCNAGETLPLNATNDLSNLLQTKVQYSFLLDIQAVTVMALSCIKSNNQKALNVSFPQADYDEAVEKFKKLQLEDGSFGNIYTTAVVTQALLSAGQENSEDWSYNKAVSHLIHHLKTTSPDFLSIYLILPILNGKCLSHIRDTNCSKFIQRDAVTSMKSKLSSKMRIQYTLNIGDEKDIVHTISLRVPENITVFEVMQLAQDADPKYRFQGKQMGETLYIYGIAGLINDFEDGKFWLLYIGKDDKSVTHTNESPDKITLQDGEHIVMWYKKADV